MENMRNARLPRSVKAVQSDARFALLDAATGEVREYGIICRWEGAYANYPVATQLDTAEKLFDFLPAGSGFYQREAIGREFRLTGQRV